MKHEPMFVEITPKGVNILTEKDNKCIVFGSYRTSDSGKHVLITREEYEELINRSNEGR